MIRIFLSHLIFSFLVISIECLNTRDRTTKGNYLCESLIPDTNLSSLLSSNGFQFALRLYYDLLILDRWNEFISPFSVLVALSMISEGVDQNAFKLMASDGYFFPGMFREKEAFEHYFTFLLCPNDRFTLSMGNRIFKRSNLPLNRTFTETLGSFFSSDVEDVDFWNNPSGGAARINQWVEQQTINSIKSFIETFNLENAALILIDTLRFNGKWEIPFDAAQTMPRVFYSGWGDEKPIRVPTMFVRDHFKYTFNKRLNSQILRLNYDGGRLAMFIVLPQKWTQLRWIVAELSADDIIFGSGNYSSVQPVDLYLPKFKVCYKDLLDSPLYYKTRGLVDESFRKLTANSEIKVSGIAHRACVGVDEAGSVAAAATAIRFDSRVAESPYKDPPWRGAPAPPPPSTPSSLSPIQFRVNRASFYLICDMRFKQILFMGILDDPSVH